MATLLAMRHLRKETMPGIPVCHRKVWIKTFISVFLCFPECVYLFPQLYVEGDTAGSHSVTVAYASLIIQL